MPRGVKIRHLAGIALQVTQLGHVKDLATAFKLVLGNEKAKGQIYNISGERCALRPCLARLFATKLICNPGSVVSSASGGASSCHTTGV